MPAFETHGGSQSWCHLCGLTLSRLEVKDLPPVLPTFRLTPSCQKHGSQSRDGTRARTEAQERRLCLGK